MSIAFRDVGSLLLTDVLQEDVWLRLKSWSHWFTWEAMTEGQRMTAQLLAAIWLGSDDPHALEFLRWAQRHAAEAHAVHQVAEPALHSEVA